MRNLIRCFLLVATVGGWSGSATSAPPEVTSVFPPGGQRGRTVEVKITGKLGKAPVKCWCSRAGVKANFNAKTGKLALTIPPQTVPGVCRLRFFNAEGASVLKAFVIGTLPEVAEKEPNNRLEESQPLKSSSVVVNGVLSKTGEVDTFSVSLKKGQTLVASMRANRTFGSPMDGVLQIVSARGFVLAQNDDDHGFDPQIAFTAPADGTYHVRTFAFPATPNSSVRLAGAANYVYRLTVTTGPFADHPDPLAVSRGSKPAVKLRGWNIPKTFGPLSVTADHPAGFATVYHPQLAGWGRVQIVPHPVVSEREPNSAERPQAVNLPATITGHVGKPRDVDAFRFSAKKGSRLVFRVEARTLGSPLDPVLRLLDSKAKIIAQAETRSSTVIDETLTTTIPADGRYRLQLRDLHRRGGWRYVYRLTMGPEQPDYALSTATDRITLQAGKPLTIPVTVKRNRLFRGEISLSVTGLPAGVVSKTVKSANKGATAKSVMLVLTVKSAMNWSGPIHVIGRSTGTEPIARVAATPIADTKETTTDLWLTVISSGSGK